MDEMLQAYQYVMTEAKETVLSRQHRNDVIPLRDMFPHGVQDLSFMLHMKTSRLLGEEANGDWAKVRDEAIDICNYAAFLVAYMDLASSEDRNEENDQLSWDAVSESIIEKLRAGTGRFG